MHKPQTTLTTRTFSKCYGGTKGNIGDIVVVDVSCDDNSCSTENKQIIFVVDKSLSMSRTLPMVKNSLVAAYDTLSKLTDAVLCPITIITFARTAEVHWTSKSSVTFHEAVNAITTSAGTNMGDALKLAFVEKIEGSAAWIILLTDGVSNNGPCKTYNDFRALNLLRPKFTKIVPLGYTTFFDPDILSLFGPMTYLKNEDMITPTFGSIMGEIVTCYGVDGNINWLNLLSNHDTGQPECTDHRTIIGSTNIDCLFNGRLYMYGIHTDRKLYIGKTCVLTYYDIVTCNNIVIESNPIVDWDTDSETPADVRKGYFSSSTERMLYSIHRTRRLHQESNEVLFRQILVKLSDWDDELSEPYKETIVNILIDNQDRGQLVDSYATMNRMKYQNTYSNDDGFARQTPGQLLGSGLSCEFLKSREKTTGLFN